MYGLDFALFDRPNVRCRHDSSSISVMPCMVRRDLGREPAGVISQAINQNDLALPEGDFIILRGVEVVLCYIHPKGGYRTCFTSGFNANARCCLGERRTGRLCGVGMPREVLLDGLGAPDC